MSTDLLVDLAPPLAMVAAVLAAFVMHWISQRRRAAIWAALDRMEAEDPERYRRLMDRRVRVRRQAGPGR